MRQRTTAFAVGVATLVEPLLSNLSVRDAVLQLKRAADSTAANYRAAGRSKSHRDFTNKLSTALEEADEALHWLDYLQRRHAVNVDAVTPVSQEAGEIVAMLSKAVSTARKRDALESARRGRPARPVLRE